MGKKQTKSEESSSQNDKRCQVKDLMVEILTCQNKRNWHSFSKNVSDTTPVGNFDDIFGHEVDEKCLALAVLAIETVLSQDTQDVFSENGFFDQMDFTYEDRKAAAENNVNNEYKKQLDTFF